MVSIGVFCSNDQTGIPSRSLDEVNAPSPNVVSSTDATAQLVIRKFGFISSRRVHVRAY